MKKEFKLIEVLESVIELVDFNINNIKSGHNGPYQDVETKVRNYAHFLVISSFLFSYKKNDKYKEFSYELINALESDEFRPMNASFLCRTNPEKDLSNGVMGQAWVMEAFIYASKTFSDEALIEKAMNLYEMHQFDEKRSLWRVLNVEGSYSGFDQTFNHQLWFAAVSSHLPDAKAKKNSLNFLRNIVKKLELYENGVIYHKSMIQHFKIEKGFGAVAVLNWFLGFIYSKKSKKNLYSKSVGYHSFNLYALALLFKSFPNDEFFKSKKMHKIMNVLSNVKFRKELVASNYSYQYNPPGFENAYALSTITPFLNKDKALRELEDHFYYTVISENELFGKNSHDYNTSMARMYELVRVEMDFEIILKIR